ncbi:hypothetical protein D3C85_1747740 [compost metagenome]
MRLIGITQLGGQSGQVACLGSLPQMSQQQGMACQPLIGLGRQTELLGKAPLDLA